MSKMKNYILAKVSNVIPYYPGLNEITGSVTASILMMQLEYWFAKQEGGMFFKFTEPCEHDLYREGDSWLEELNFGKEEFKGAFNRIGKCYKSKSQFVNQKDGNLFEGKLYASYYDRQKRLTYYFRNNDFVDKILEEWISNKESIPISKKREKAISKKQEIPISSKQENTICVEGKNQPLETGNSDLQKQENPISTDGNFPFPHISVDYYSRLQQKTTTNKNKPAQVQEYILNLFGTYAGQDVELLETLIAFNDMRNELKNGKMTQRAAELMLKELDKLGTDRVTKIAILNRSIQNNWKGIFELPQGYALPAMQSIQLDDGTVVETGQVESKSAFDKLREKYGE
ncbi:hypothetical protein PBV87_19235 [Niameybacter massiliensis]|uniref:Uncharacterized protein n=1 Tax=Holtiella tumoricola TaxID=3018743 RepID=A0AA42J2E5_9FIRM|nr:hypothetical protein [Holtiella tumoricola]MDA3733607.1 hypothetical protein [Holtiella tumoricola]